MFSDTEILDLLELECAAQDVSTAPKPSAVDLEASGWRDWLITLFPFAFEDEFSADHIKFWNLYWSVLFRIREQQKYHKLGLPLPAQFEIKPEEFIILLILGRGLGKSQTLEASSIMRGAILGGGYCLYICETQDQANEHVSNTRELIEHPESRIAEFYPGMGQPKQTKFGNQASWSKDIFITGNGWICRAKGLNASLRGLRIGNQRPDDIVIDDIDGVNDSIAASVNKLRQLTSSVLPTQARRWATIKFGQNLICENGVMNQIYTGKSDALSERTTIGATATFIKFDYETFTDERDGRVKHRILPTSIPSWSGVNAQSAQKFLNDSGLETFLAEYQNEFEHLKQGKVIHAYNEERHVVTWSEFERVFGCRYIPKHWKAEGGADIGYTANSLASWVFRATSAMNTKLPGKKFIYRNLNFQNVSIDDQAVRLWTEFFPNYEIGKRHFEALTDFGAYPELLRLLRLKPTLAPFLTDYVPNPLENRYDLSKTNFQEIAQQLFQTQLRGLLISHEKSGELKTLTQKYGLPVQKTKNFGANDGITEWNHLLHGDYTKPHPFKSDELLPDGTYRLGCPELFYLVEDGQDKIPRDDNGLKTHRENIQGWEYTKEKLTDYGLTESKPMKFNSDSLDAERMIHVQSWGTPTALTNQEQFDHYLNALHPNLTPEAMAAEEVNKIGKMMALKLVQNDWEKQNNSRPAEQSEYTDWARQFGMDGASEL